jgi:glycerol kinase
MSFILALDQGTTSTRARAGVTAADSAVIRISG